jgi:SAM-dependent methyltransferase
MAKKTGDKIIRELTAAIALPLTALPDKVLSMLALNIIGKKAKSLPPDESLRFLLELDNKLYGMQGSQSVRYGGGLHTKHRHTNYHQFFIEQVAPDSTIIDLGCGNGALSHDIATKHPGTSIIGIDLNPKNIAKAKERFASKNITYLCGDILDDNTLPPQDFDTIILSNVLEHLPGRAGFLKAIQKKLNPRQILIRVPLFERDWRVPLKKELGIEWRLDATHETEYTLESWEEELKNAGLEVAHQEIRWGEIWAKVHSINQ